MTGAVAGLRHCHTGRMWREVLVAVVAGLVATWLAVVVALLVVRPRGSLLKESVRLLPDLLRLLRDLATDRSQPRGVRVRLGLLIGYLALPFDLVPDFLPVVGYADDVVVVVWTLRSVVRRVGLEELRRHWRGSDDGFEALRRVAGLGGPGVGG
jgi:uncharacterized membrane protein YkvA (DUF1232 family)